MRVRVCVCVYLLGVAHFDAFLLRLSFLLLNFAGPSAVTAVAVVTLGESVVLRAYDDTIAMLMGWKPPLNLIFRRAPVKDGLLKKIVITEKPQKAREETLPGLGHYLAFGLRGLLSGKRERGEGSRHKRRR